MPQTGVRSSSRKSEARSCARGRASKHVCTGAKCKEGEEAAQGRMQAKKERQGLRPVGMGAYRDQEKQELVARKSGASWCKQSGLLLHGELNLSYVF